jgi:hypothetical protein
MPTPMISMFVMVPTQNDPEQIEILAASVPRQGEVITLPDNRHFVVSRIEWVAETTGHPVKYRAVLWLGL